METLLMFGAGVLGGAAAWLVMVLVAPRRKDVDELAVDVERISKIVKRYQMQRVREAAEGLGDIDPAAVAAALKGKAPAAPVAVDPHERKNQLRRLL